MTDVVALDSLTEEPAAHVFPGREPRTVRLALDAGEGLPAHRHPDRRVVFHVLEGRVELALDDDAVTLDAGDVARFDGARDISPRAVEPATALLVLAEKPEA